MMNNIENVYLFLINLWPYNTLMYNGFFILCFITSNIGFRIFELWGFKVTLKTLSNLHIHMHTRTTLRLTEFVKIILCVILLVFLSSFFIFLGEYSSISNNLKYETCVSCVCSWNSNILIDLFCSYAKIYIDFVMAFYNYYFWDAW